MSSIARILGGDYRGTDKDPTAHGLEGDRCQTVFDGSMMNSVDSSAGTSNSFTILYAATAQEVCRATREEDTYWRTRYVTEQMMARKLHDHRQRRRRLVVSSRR